MKVTAIRWQKIKPSKPTPEKNILELMLEPTIQERYGVSLRTYAARGYHLFEYEEDIIKDIVAKGTG